jgi:hypothetical protein
MRKLTLTGLLLIGATLFSGCTTPPIDWGSTPAYSSRERGRLIWRNWNNEGAQINDDIDSALLLRPQSRMTIWHVR